MGKEHFFEFSYTQSSVSRIVVSSDEELALIERWKDANGVESSLKLVDINGSISWHVKNSESINNVEVWLVSKLDLGILNFLLKVAYLFKGMNKLILLVKRKNWLS